jgi:hypothetical protein
MKEARESRVFIRFSEAGHLLENFLIAAVSSILVIRFFLQVTGYPQLGGGGLHIAHMLWGGLLMLVALVILLSFLNKEAKSLAAVLGGVGFGTFVDEIGKFVTSDNDYFYEPAIAIIYAIFVLLFLLFRVFERNSKLSSREYLINTLEATKDVVVHDLDEKEKQLALRFLKRADSDEPVAKMLKDLLVKIEALPAPEPNFFSRFRKRLHKLYLTWVENDWFIRIVITFFITSSIFALFRVLILIPFSRPQTVSELFFIISSGISGLFVAVGIYLARRSRLGSYQMFKRAVLISIFLTQFFLFINDQLAAVVGLGFSLLTLVTLQYLITEERLIEKEN